MEIGETKEVYFHRYCPECKHKDLKSFEKLCQDCLAQPFNYYSHKPIMFESAIESWERKHD